MTPCDFCTVHACVRLNSSIKECPYFGDNGLLK